VPSLTTRPATAADAADPTFDDLLPDRWHEGVPARGQTVGDAIGVQGGVVVGAAHAAEPCRGPADPQFGDVLADRARDWVLVRSMSYLLRGLEQGLTIDPPRCRRLLDLLG